MSITSDRLNSISAEQKAYNRLPYAEQQKTTNPSTVATVKTLPNATVSVPTVTNTPAKVTTPTPSVKTLPNATVSVPTVTNTPASVIGQKTITTTTPTVSQPVNTAPIVNGVQTVPSSKPIVTTTQQPGGVNYNNGLDAKGNATKPIVTTPTVTTPTVTTPTVTTPTVTTPTVTTPTTLRDVATTNGITIGNNGSIPIINGQEIDPSKFGLTLVDGRWQGTPDQIAKIFGMGEGLRENLEAIGRTLEYNPTTGQVSVNGIPVDTSGMLNIGGRYYTTQENLNKIFNATGGKYAVGTDPNQPNAMTSTGVRPPTDVTLDAQGNPILSESDTKIKELQRMIDELKSKEFPQQNFEAMAAIVKAFQDYKSPYDQQIKDILAQTFKDFSYDPENDPLLDKAVKYADRTMMEQLNSRGILNSSMTADNMRIIREDLIPKYQDLALQNYNKQLEVNFKRLDVLQSLTQDDYNRYKDFTTLSLEMAEKISKNTIETYKANLELLNNSIVNQINLDKYAAEIKAEEYKRAMDRYKELGYVDNEISKITGLPVGTRSREVTNQIQERYDKFLANAIQNQQAVDMQNLKYKQDQQQIKDAQKQKDIEEARKANTAKLAASLGNMSADQALETISKNSTALSEYMGSDLYTLIADLKSQKAKEEIAKAEKEQNRIINERNAKNDANELAIKNRSLQLESQRIDIARKSEERQATKEKEKVEKPMTKAEYNDWIGRAVGLIQAKPVDDAKADLLDTQNVASMISAVGLEGYKTIWNLSLQKAIAAKTAKDFDTYFSNPDVKPKINANPIDEEIAKKIRESSVNLFGAED